MKNAQVYGRAAIRGFMASLPRTAHSVYFRDPIGNISTTSLNYRLQALEVILSPRYPLFGGWVTEFTLGYSLPLGVSFSLYLSWKFGNILTDSYFYAYWIEFLYWLNKGSCNKSLHALKQTLLCISKLERLNFCYYITRVTSYARGLEILGLRRLFLSLNSFERNTSSLSASVQY